MSYGNKKDEEPFLDDAQKIYCPDCGDDYTLVFSESEDGVFIVCGCSEAEDVQDFLRRFMDEFGSTKSMGSDDKRMYQ